MLKVLVVGQIPPPYHGQAIMIQRFRRGPTRRRRTDSRAHAVFDFYG